MGRLMMGIRVVLKVLRHTYNALNVHGGQAKAEEARIEHLSEAKHCVCMLMEAPHCDEPSCVFANRTCDRTSISARVCMMRAGAPIGETLLQILEREHRLAVTAEDVDHTLSTRVG